MFLEAAIWYPLGSVLYGFALKGQEVGRKVAVPCCLFVGLGNRIAYQFVRLFGKTSLGLTYSLVFSEAVLAPAIPSVAARAGGIFLPLVKALSEACGSRVGDGTERKLGAYLCLTCFQTSTISSAMFLTAMAANPLSAKLALSTVGAEITWGSWALAASVPGILSLIAIPLVVYILYPPEMKSSPEAPAQVPFVPLGH